MVCLYMAAPLGQLCMSGVYVAGVQYHPIKDFQKDILCYIGKSIDFIIPADSVRRLEMQNFGFTTVLCQF